MKELNYTKVSDTAVVGCYKLEHKSLTDFYIWLQRIPSTAEIKKILIAADKDKFEEIGSIATLISLINANLVSCFTFKIDDTTTLGFDLDRWMLIIMGSDRDVKALVIRLDDL